MLSALKIFPKKTMNRLTQFKGLLVVYLYCRMKKLVFFGLSVGFCLASNSLAAQTAQARLFCLSVRLQQGVYHGLLGDVTLDLSTINDAANGELAPSAASANHVSGYLLFDTVFDEVIARGRLDLNTPAFVDDN